ncbi:putative NBS resistance protein [Trifolium pratense]|uniref:Putative NBS resistance protein n=1 Tax=Trifolium pratense TaxID=57577 RepID=A0A2K3PD38_TRIPR|nr:putative NBS resistance protein [Trifolium pratense]
MAVICQWPCLASVPSKPVTVVKPQRSFAQVLDDSSVVQFNPLPSPVLKGDALFIKISKEEYEKALDDGKRKLHGRLILSK